MVIMTGKLRDLFSSHYNTCLKQNADNVICGDQTPAFNTYWIAQYLLKRSTNLMNLISLDC